MLFETYFKAMVRAVPVLHDDGFYVCTLRLLVRESKAESCITLSDIGLVRFLCGRLA